MPLPLTGSARGSRDRARLGVLSHSAELYSTRRLLEAAAARGIEAVRIDPIRVVIHVDSGGPHLSDDGARLPAVGWLLPRVGSTLTDWGLALVDALVAGGAWCPGSADAIRRAQDKLATAHRLVAHGVPTVPAVALREAAHVEDAVAAAGGGPWVLKLRHGTQGRHVMAAPTAEAARSVAGSLVALGHTVLVQPWLSPADGSPRDLRVLVAGYEPIAACWRHARAGEFRANVHQGGATVAAELTPAAAELAAAAARALELPLCGVDLLPTHDGLRVLEVNGSPGLEGIERATGRDLAGDVLAWAQRASR